MSNDPNDWFDRNKLFKRFLRLLPFLIQSYFFLEVSGERLFSNLSFR